jgi:hypothetical protein
MHIRTHRSMHTHTHLASTHTQVQEAMSERGPSQEDSACMVHSPFNRREGVQHDSMPHHRLSKQRGRAPLGRSISASNDKRVAKRRVQGVPTPRVGWSGIGIGSSGLDVCRGGWSVGAQSVAGLCPTSTCRARGFTELVGRARRHKRQLQVRCKRRWRDEAPPTTPTMADHSTCTIPRPTH